MKTYYVALAYVDEWGTITPLADGEFKATDEQDAQRVAFPALWDPNLTDECIPHFHAVVEI